MSTFLKPLLAREELLRRGVRIFTAREFHRIFRAPRDRTKYFLEKQTKQGLLVRLKQGIYALKTDIPNEEEIANALYRPSYISFEYALGYYNMLPEMPYVVANATTKPTRLFTSQDKTFAYYTIKKTAYTGYSLVKMEKKSFLIADPEKALADYLYYVSIGHRKLNVRIATGNINKELLRRYAMLFERENLLKIIKTL